MIRTEQEQLRLRLHQGAERAARMDMAVPGRFVTGEERAVALHEAHESGVQASFYGGYDEAERVQVCFHPAYEEPVFTAQWVEAAWHARFGSPEHRALLGSLMALGMDRAFFGDLVAQEDCAYLYTMPETAVRLPMEWQQAGRITLKVRVLDEPPALRLPEGDMLHDTVASLRLDCVLASGMKCSRSKAADLIRQGLVMVAHQPEERTDRLLDVGDLLSIRGFGRIRLRDVGDPTRKERLPITLEVFGKR